MLKNPVESMDNVELDAMRDDPFTTLSYHLQGKMTKKEFGRLLDKMQDATRRRKRGSRSRKKSSQKKNRPGQAPNNGGRTGGGGGAVSRSSDGHDLPESA